MKITNALFADEGFIKIINKINDSNELPIKSAFQFHKLTKQITEHQTDYNDVRQKIFKKFGSENLENGQVSSYTIPEDKLDEANKELIELSEVVVDIKFTKLPFPENLKIKPKEIKFIEDIFDLSSL